MVYEPWGRGNGFWTWTPPRVCEVKNIFIKILRHFYLPYHVICSVGVLAWIKAVAPNIPVFISCTQVPEGRKQLYPLISEIFNCIKIYSLSTSLFDILYNDTEITHKALTRCNDCLKEMYLCNYKFWAQSAVCFLSHCHFCLKEQLMNHVYSDLLQGNNQLFVAMIKSEVLSKN